MQREKEEAALLLEDLFDELDEVLKKPEIVAHLTEKGINTSLALLIADGLRAYLEGKKQEAADDLGTAAEEIAARLGMASGASGSGASGNGGQLLS
jgi:hypothetical protein